MSIKTFVSKYCTKTNATIVLSTALMAGVASAADGAAVGPTAADFDSLKTAILTLVAGLGASALAIMVASQGWQIALGVAKRFFNRAAS
ncbi:hypothetical protein [Photobacterium leiognathi]|uniref:hypothetical protein n=1 Tax=Photobacterium leiognathi TaxID=553611 RepID=UPI002981B137|nr:hypothetical protein [Photobacterium leiognathi]